jgi:signal peptidase II
MDKKEWRIQIMLVLAVSLVDICTKSLALEFIRSLNFWGPFGLVLHKNPGAMLGMFSDLPPVLRIVTLSTGGAFLVLIYFALQYLIPMRAPTLRYGMSILLGGILGNVSDRILHGSVVDFLLIRVGKFISPAFNIADSVQWVGYGLIVYSLFKYGNVFWPSTNFRRKLWVNPGFQLKFVASLCVMGMGFILISGVFFYTYLKVVIDETTGGMARFEENRFLTPFLTTYFVVAIGFLLILIIVGRVLSHRMAGPLYAFEKFLEELLAGKPRPLRLRAGDEFQHLEDLAQNLRNHVAPGVPDQEHEDPSDF